MLLPNSILLFDPKSAILPSRPAIPRLPRADAVKDCEATTLVLDRVEHGGTLVLVGQSEVKRDGCFPHTLRAGGR